jgi:hypothetical protein
MKFFLSFILVFTIAIFLVSFKLPEIKVFKFYSTPISNVVVVNESKMNKPPINEIKITGHQNHEIKNLGGESFQLFSRFQLILINIFTPFLIFLIFLIKIKYFD